MMKKVILIVFLTFNMAGLMSQESIGNTVEVSILDIDGNDGKLMVGLYNAEANWLKKPVKAQLGKINNEKSSVTFKNVSDGVYAISLFHDENDNGELDMNFLGIPKEDTGASNNAPARFGPPQWEDAKFEVKGKSVKQTINL